MDEKSKLFLYALLFTAILLLGNLSGGYRLDEQLNYPQDNKHSIRLTRKTRKYLFIKNKKTKYSCLRAAYRQEIAGYFQALFFSFSAAILAIINCWLNGLSSIWKAYFWILFICLGIDIVYIIIVSAYYKIRFRDLNKYNIFNQLKSIQVIYWSIGSINPGGDCYGIKSEKQNAGSFLSIGSLRNEYEFHFNN